MSFEILFITERPEGAPAAEIQFNGRRLCCVRFSEARDPQIEFDQGLDVGNSTLMAFPLLEFQTAMHLAVDHLADWLRYLAARSQQAGASVQAEAASRAG